MPSTTFSQSPVWPSMTDLCRTAERRRFQHSNHDLAISAGAAQIGMLSFFPAGRDRATITLLSALIVRHATPVDAVLPWHPSCDRCMTPLRSCIMTPDREDCIRLRCHGLCKLKGMQMRERSMKMCVTLLHVDNYLLLTSRYTNSQLVHNPSTTRPPTLKTNSLAQQPSCPSVAHH
jgi:hypothetical protein